MESRIMYIEMKDEDGHTDRGPARIGRVTFSNSGKTIHYRDQKFRSLKGGGFCGNYYDVETDDPYWISGCKKNGQDRLFGKGEVAIDADVREEYWTDTRNSPHRAGEAVT